MEVKLYSNPSERCKKTETDNNILVEFKNLPEHAQSQDTLIGGLRELIAVGKTDDYDLLKPRLKCFNAHNLADITSTEFISTGILCFDIDKIDEAKINSIKRNNSFYYSYMVSPSGKGIKLFLKVKNLNADNFKLVYNKLAIKIENIVNRGVTDRNLHTLVDYSSNDINRLCYLSASTDWLIQDEVEELDAESYYTPEELLQLKENQKRKVWHGKTRFKDVEQLIDLLKENNYNIAGNYDELKTIINCFCSLKDELNEDKIYSFIHKLFGDSFKSGRSGTVYIVKDIFNHIYRWYNTSSDKKTTIGTFIFLCKTKFGLEIEKPKPVYHQHFTKKSEVVYSYLNFTYNKYSLCKYSSEMLYFDGDNYTEILPLEPDVLYTNYNDNYIYYTCLEKSKEGVTESNKYIKTEFSVFKVNPNEWNSFFKQWIVDKKTDTSKIFFDSIIAKYDKSSLKLEEFKKFADIFYTFSKNDSKEFFIQKLKALLKSIIKRSLGNKSEFCGALVSKSEGLGKTDLLRKFLFKDFIEQSLYHQLKLTDDEWKTTDYLSKNIICEVDEKGVGVNQNNILKNLVSSETETIKPKNSNKQVNKISRGTILFTTNDLQFLKSNSEDNRRYLIFELGKEFFDIVNEKVIWKIKDIYFTKVWAELYNEYLSDDSIIINFADVKAFNNRYKVKTSYENKNNQLLNDFCNMCEDAKGIECYVNANDVQLIMSVFASGSYDMSKSNQDMITKHFRDLNYDYKKTKSSLFAYDSIVYAVNKDWTNCHTLRYKVKLSNNLLHFLKDQKNYEHLDIYKKM